MATQVVLEKRAREAIRKGKQAWSFIFDPKTEPLPDNFDQAIKAMVLTGAVPTDIVGAITIAAMRQSCTNHWAYACGVVRSTVAARLAA